MIRSLVFILLFVPALGRGDDDKKPDGKEAGTPQVQISHPGPVRFGGFWLGAGAAYARGHQIIPFSRFYRPWYWYDPWYDIFSPVGVFENCYAYPGPCRFFQPPTGAEAGEISLKTERSEAMVFINGGYAGQARDLEKMKLPAGIYELRIEETGFEPFQQKIYLLSGKKVKIQPALTPREVRP